VEITDLTLEELKAIGAALSQLIDDGFAQSDDDPIVTALIKVTEAVQLYEEGEDPGYID
jgi:hypothetical protein